VHELLPYDLPAPAPDELIVQVGGGAGEPERLLHISRPVEGLVRVREWTSESWNIPPLERELAAPALLRALEEAARQRRRLSQELVRVRQWLTDGV
jgi:hypothetical protein